MEKIRDALRGHCPCSESQRLLSPLVRCRWRALEQPDRGGRERLPTDGTASIRLFHNAKRHFSQYAATLCGLRIRVKHNVRNSKDFVLRCDQMRCSTCLDDCRSLSSTQVCYALHDISCWSISRSRHLGLKSCETMPAKTGKRILPGASYRSLAGIRGPN